MVEIDILGKNKLVEKTRSSIFALWITERFKIYASDTGIFVTLAFKDKDFTDNIIYEKLLNDKLSTNLGYVYENVIAQMLRATGKQLFYHTIPFADGKKYYEVDFLISDGHKVSPI